MYKLKLKKTCRRTYHWSPVASALINFWRESEDFCG